MNADRIPESGEIVGEFGNTYIVEGEDGNQYSVARTPAYELAYIHGEEELVFGGPETPPTFFEADGCKVRIEPTRSDRVYTIQVDDGRPVQNAPSERGRVLKGLLEAVANDTVEILTHLYEDLLDRQVDKELLGRVQREYAPIPPASVNITDDGWIIEDMFLLTWLGNVYLVTRNFDEPTYRISGSVRRTDEDVEFIGLTPGGDIEAFEVGGETLSECEMEFLHKAYWLSTYRDRHDDDLFWDLIERHVQSTRKTAQEKVKNNA